MNCSPKKANKKEQIEGNWDRKGDIFDIITFSLYFGTLNDIEMAESFACYLCGRWFPFFIIRLFLSELLVLVLVQHTVYEKNDCRSSFIVAPWLF